MAKFNILEWKRNEVLVVAGFCLVIFGISKYQIVIGAMKTRDSQRMQDTSLVSRALRTYYDDYKEYPMEATGEGKILACGEKGSQACEWGKSKIVDRFNVAYLNLVPGEPMADFGRKYVYKVSSDLQHFKIYTALEYSGSAKFKSDLTIECGNRVQCNWYEGE